ncbi:MAG: hypothetical protein H6716_25125 [Polyangiaceae bacterium]|nr:hypothetical protein [Polyangiaceae bacterium]
MKLNPHQNPLTRREKTMRHYYGKEERWWALSSQPREAWARDWWALRELLGELDGWTLVEFGSKEDAVLENGHGYWLSTSERACVEARDRHWVYPGVKPNRTIYIGRGGITVVVAASGPESDVVTAFRVIEESGDPDDPLDFEACERKAVRKYGRYTSYLPNGENL